MTSISRPENLHGQIDPRPAARSPCRSDPSRPVPAATAPPLPNPVLTDSIQALSTLRSRLLQIPLPHRARIYARLLPPWLPTPRCIPRHSRSSSSWWWCRLLWRLRRRRFSLSRRGCRCRTRRSPSSSPSPSPRPPPS